MPRKTVVQKHHITYLPEWVVTVYKGEHYILSLIQWRRRFSKGFFLALHDFVEKNEKFGVELK